MNSFTETLKQLGPARLGIMGAMMVGLLLFFVFVSLRVSAPAMKLLYSDLSSMDSGAIAAKLEENQIPYEVSEDGQRIVVPDDQVGKARILLAEAGLPNGGSLGYELFDKTSGFGTTNFVQNINQVRALEGELARTISSMENIRSTRVHLVLPQRELFSRETRPSTASVFLGVRPGSQLGNQEIMAIQSLVSSAVPDLKPGNVSIVDSNGNLLAKGEDEGTDLMSMKAEERRVNYERRLTEKLEDQIGRIVGFGNVRATVTAEINFDQINTNEELYDPEGQVLRSTQSTTEANQEREGGSNEVGVEQNLPAANSDLLANNSPSVSSNRQEEISNFEISKTIRSTVREVGEVNRLSVAVLINGVTTTDAEGKETYTPRAQAELDQLSALVKSAVGFDEERGDKVEVVNMQFAAIDTNEDFVDDTLLMGFDKNKLLDMAEMLTVTIMIVLVVMLVLKPMVNRLLTVDPNEKRDAPMPDMLASRPPTPALAAPERMSELPEQEESLINIAGVEGKVKASSIKKVEEIVENYPSETVSVIRSWMTQETQ